VSGADTLGVESDCARDRAAAICIAMAQWCAPLRRQHSGRLESSLASRVAESGPSAKSAIRKMEKQRRI